jgi:sulfur carrier protein
MTRTGENLVKLILRDKVYEVKAGMDLLSALKRNNIVPESVIATREGEMIVEDEILKDGDEVKLIAVISGGSCYYENASGWVSIHRKKKKRGYSTISPRNDEWLL